MGVLRDRMIKCLAVSGLSEQTQYSYLQAVKRLTQHFQTAPDRLTNERIHEYFVFLAKKKRFSQGYFKMTRAAVAFLYKRVCPRAIEEMETWKPPRRATIPEVMSPDGVYRALRNGFC